LAITGAEVQPVIAAEEASSKKAQVRLILPP
jgi:hypothetical protein